MDVVQDRSKRAALNELSGPPKQANVAKDPVLSAIEALAQQVAGVGKQLANVESSLSSQLATVAAQLTTTQNDVKELKTVQASQAEQLVGLAGALQQQQLELNISKRMQFHSGFRKQVLFLGPIGLNNKDPKTVVISTLTDAIIASTGGNRQDTERVLLQNLSEFYAIDTKKPGLKSIKFHVADPKVGNGIWGAKQKLQGGVYLDPMLTPLERSNKKDLASNPEFKVIRDFAAKQGKGKKGIWQLDEFVLRWEADGQRVQAFYHKAYPRGMLADGKPAPPYPG
jgi:hypothetical protein